MVEDRQFCWPWSLLSNKMVINCQKSFHFVLRMLKNISEKYNKFTSQKKFEKFVISRILIIKGGT